MNRENIKTLIKALEGGTIEVGGKKVGFNMGCWWQTTTEYSDKSGHGCGTVACIGGWADLIFGGGIDPNRAADILGLDENTADDLFYCSSADRALSSITMPEAITTLKKLLRTGKVDWSHAK